VLLHESAFEYARSRPDAPAVVCGAERLSYRDLDQRANAVAHALQQRGTRPGRLVGICAHRGIDGLVGLLGILKSGCTYVPLDPDYPRERLDFMVRDSEIDTVVVDAPQTARQLPTVGVVAVCDTPGRLEQPRTISATSSTPRARWAGRRVR
jgi:non-ribosomal peptide synthetase component F